MGDNRLSLANYVCPGGLVSNIMNRPLEGCSDEVLQSRAIISTLVTIAQYWGVIQLGSFLLGDSGESAAQLFGYASVFMNFAKNSCNHLNN